MAAQRRVAHQRQPLGIAVIQPPAQRRHAECGCLPVSRYRAYRHKVYAAAEGEYALFRAVVQFFCVGWRRTVADTGWAWRRIEHVVLQCAASVGRVGSPRLRCQTVLEGAEVRQRL